VSYRDTLLRLSGRSEEQATALFAAWQAGKVDDDTFVALLAAIVAAANNQATALADLSLATAVTVALRRPVVPLGIAPPAEDPERLRKAATTLLTVKNLTPERVARLARAEPLETAARAYSAGMARSPHVRGWRRGLSGSACQLCEWWSRGGQLWPADHPMPTHKGCSCSPVPITT
jgi:hypothetical protein